MELKVFSLFFVVLAVVKISGQNLEKLRNSVSSEDQRSYIKINVLLDTAPKVVLAQLKTAYPQGHLSRKSVYNWYGDFKEGRRTDVSDLPRSGRPRTTTDEEHKENVRQLILESEGMRTEDLMYETNLAHTTLLRLLKEINARKIMSRWIPHELSKRQEQARWNVAGKHLARYQRERGFLDKILSIDESWVKSYDPVDSRASSEWLLPGQKP
jgi:transposase